MNKQKMNDVECRERDTQRRDHERKTLEKFNRRIIKNWKRIETTVWCACEWKCVCSMVTCYQTQNTKRNRANNKRDWDYLRNDFIVWINTKWICRNSKRLKLCNDQKFGAVNSICKEGWHPILLFGGPSQLVQMRLHHSIYNRFVLYFIFSLAFLFSFSLIRRISMASRFPLCKCNALTAVDWPLRHIVTRAFLKLIHVCRVCTVYGVCILHTKYFWALTLDERIEWLVSF